MGCGASQPAQSRPVGIGYEDSHNGNSVARIVNTTDNDLDELDSPHEDNHTRGVLPEETHSVVSDPFKMPNFGDGLELLEVRCCSICKAAEPRYQCAQCENPFFVCGECIFVVDDIHDPDHQFVAVPEPDVDVDEPPADSMSMSIFCMAFLYQPCRSCKKQLEDTERVYRCSACNEVKFDICEKCFVTNAHGHDPAHEFHPIQRGSQSQEVRETKKVSKRTDKEGNKVINNYSVVKQLGRGSYGKVKLVQHVITHELSAVKIIRRPRNVEDTPGRKGQLRMSDVMREVAIWKLLNHPNITKLFEIIDDPTSEKVYIVMEFLARGPLTSEGKIPLDKLRGYASDLVQGLHYLHSQELYHRDIKPANCLVSSTGVAKLADFGTLNDQGCRDDLLLGTPAFMAPEYFRGEACDFEKADAWAFGVTLYEAAYGHLPFASSNLKEIRESMITGARIHCPSISGGEEFVDLLEKLLDKSPSNRLPILEAINHPFFGSLLENPLDFLFAQWENVDWQSAISAGDDVGNHFCGMGRTKRNPYATRATIDDDMSRSFGGSMSGSCSSPSRGSRRKNNLSSQAAIRDFVNSCLSGDKKLSLHDVDLGEFPTVLKESREIVELSLSKNKLSPSFLLDIPWSQFCNLREVAITHNKLLSVPESLLEIPMLVALALDHNELSNLPAAMSNCQHLEKLSLHHNKFRAIPHWAFLGPKLSYVRLSSNTITESFPSQLKNCVSLRIVLDNLPHVVDQWSNDLILKIPSVCVVWNDVWPRPVTKDLFVGAIDSAERTELLQHLDIALCVYNLPDASCVPRGGPIEMWGIDPAGSFETISEAFDTRITKILNEGSNVLVCFDDRDDKGFTFPLIACYLVVHLNLSPEAAAKLLHSVRRRK